MAGPGAGRPPGGGPEAGGQTLAGGSLWGSGRGVVKALPAAEDGRPSWAAPASLQCPGAGAGPGGGSAPGQGRGRAGRAAEARPLPCRPQGGADGPGLRGGARWGARGARTPGAPAALCARPAASSEAASRRAGPAGRIPPWPTWHLPCSQGPRTWQPVCGLRGLPWFPATQQRLC